MHPNRNPSRDPNVSLLVLQSDPGSLDGPMGAKEGATNAKWHILGTKTETIRSRNHMTSKLHAATSDPAQIAAETFGKNIPKQQAKVKGPASWAKP